MTTYSMIDARRRRQRRNKLLASLAVAVIVAAIYTVGVVGWGAQPRQMAAAGPVTYATTTVTPMVKQVWKMPLGSSVRDATPDGSIKIGVTKVKRVSTCGTYEKPTGGHQFLIVYLVGEVLSGKANVNPYDWIFRTTTGTTVEAAVADCHTAAGVGDWPGENGVRAGGRVVGYIVFDVRKGARGDLVYEPGVDDVASWRVD